MTDAPPWPTAPFPAPPTPPSPRNEPSGPLSVDEYRALLGPPRDEWEYYNKSLLAQRYFGSCAECIRHESLEIVDPDGRLSKFEEVYLAFLAIIKPCSDALVDRVTRVESSLDLAQNVVRLSNLSVSTPQRRSPFFRWVTSGFSASIGGLELTFPSGEQRPITAATLLDIRTALTRLAGLAGAAAREAQDWWMELGDVIVVDGIYDPRRVPTAMLALRIERAIGLVESAELPQHMKEKLVRELKDAKAELERRKPSWNKIISKISQVLLLLGALVPVVADVDDAKNNLAQAYQVVQEAFRFIAERALDRPYAPGAADVRLAIPGPSAPRLEE